MRALISRQQNCFFVKHTVPKDQFKAQASGSTLDLIYEILSLLAHTHTDMNKCIHTRKMCCSGTIEVLFWVGPPRELVWVGPVVLVEGEGAPGADIESGLRPHLFHSKPKRRKGK